jgi:uncharacterized protein YjbJ (UPF0337 family)
MAGEVDKAKGRAKKAAGDLTDNPDLRAEGEIDEATGKAKSGATKAADKTREVVTGKKK